MINDDIVWAEQTVQKNNVYVSNNINANLALRRLNLDRLVMNTTLVSDL